MSHSGLVPSSLFSEILTVIFSPARVRCRAPARSLHASITNALHYRRHDFLLWAAGDNGLGASLAAKGIAASCEHVSVMAEAIEQCHRKLFAAEHLGHLERPGC
jgi:hypothetical protein